LSTKVFINHIDFALPTNIESNSSILKVNKKSNFEIKKMIDKIGIYSRRVSLNKYTSSQLAEEVGNKIFKKYDKNSFDFFIYCTNSPDTILPPNSCVLQNKLGLGKDVGSLDVNLSCSGYIYSLGLAKSLIASGEASKILLITSDTYSRYISKKDYKNRIIFGDGATASVISKKKEKKSFLIGKFKFGTDGSFSEAAVFKNFGSYYHQNLKKEIFEMNGPEILNFALREVPTLIKSYTKKNKINLKSIDYFLFHQANEFIIRSLQEKIGIPNHKIIVTMKKTGNTVSSSIPLALNASSKKIPNKSKVLLVGFGGGLSWGVTLVNKV
jgi:3-oxoacyl-[acyl-carrier-protein] synthase-3